MNKAPWIFLGVLFTLGLSWWGMVYGPATQLGNESADLGGGQELKPRVGLAQQGEQVYRENGCYYCHTRTAASGEFGYELQLTQLGDDRNATEDAIGTNRMTGIIEQSYNLKIFFSEETKLNDAKKAFEDANATWMAAKAKPENVQMRADLEKKFNDSNTTFVNAKSEFKSVVSKVTDSLKKANLSEADDLTSLGLAGLPLDTTFAGILDMPVDSLTAAQSNAVENATITITKGTEQWAEIATMVRKLKTRAGAQFKLQPVAGDWPDVQNGAAPRQSVSRDFMFDAVAMPGVMRLGPDLSNVGARLVGDDAKHYAHLYDARSTVAKSKMPPYRYLFTRQKIGAEDALPPGSFEMTEGEGAGATRYAVTPKAKARALLAYLRSLRLDRKLPEAPLVETRAAAPKKD